MSVFRSLASLVGVIKQYIPYNKAIVEGDTATASAIRDLYLGYGYTITSSTKYTINGLISPDNTCANNIKQIMLACNSWGTYNYKKGKWSAVVNRAATAGELNAAFIFDDTNILSEITVTSTGLDQLYNSVEIEYNSANLKDQKDFVTLDLPDTMRNDYEPDNQLKLNIPLCNTSTQATKLGMVYLKQAREDITVEFNADYSAIQVDAGDVIKITNDVYGWVNKLFRVMVIREMENEDGMLMVNIRAIEYNEDVYRDEPLIDFIPSPNTNIPIRELTVVPPAPSIYSIETANVNPTFTFKAVIPQTPTYTITQPSTQVNENSSITFTLNTTNVADETMLYWEVEPTFPKYASLTDFVATNGYVFVNSNTGNFTVSTIADLTTEGGEYFRIRLRTAPGGRVIAYSSTILINDTSQSPTYTIVPQQYSVNEGGVFTFNVTTTNVLNGTTLYWTINNLTTTNDDFVATSGSFTINNNAGSFTVDTEPDAPGGSGEYFIVNLKTGSTSGPTVRNTPPLIINEVGVGNTYSITPSVFSVTEGNSVTFTVNTTNVANGTTLYWMINYIYAEAGDFDIIYGEFTINNNTGSFTVDTIDDLTDDVTKLFNVSVKTGSTSGVIIATSDVITINNSNQLYSSNTSYNTVEYWVSSDGGTTKSLATVSLKPDSFTPNDIDYGSLKGYPAGTYLFYTRVGKVTPNSPTVYSEFSPPSLPFVWNPATITNLTTVNLSSDWFPSPVIIPDDYGTTYTGTVRRLQIRDGSNIIPVSTATTDDAMANNSWRPFDDGFQDLDGWSWSRSINTTYNCVEWTFSIENGFTWSTMAKTQSQSPVIRYKDAVGSVSSFICSSTVGWKQQSFFSSYSQDGRSLQIETDYQAFTRPQGFTDAQTSNYTPANINIKARKQNISSTLSFYAVGSDGAQITLTGTGDNRTLSNTNFGNRDWVKIIVEAVETNETDPTLSKYGEKETFHDEYFIYRVRQSVNENVIAAVNDMICIPTGGLYGADGIIDVSKFNTQINVYNGSTFDTNNWAYQITNQTGITDMFIDNNDYKGRISYNGNGSPWGTYSVGMISTIDVRATKSGESDLYKTIIYHRNPVDWLPIYGQYGQNFYEFTTVNANMKQVVIYRNTPALLASGGPRTLVLKACPYGLNAGRDFTWTATPEIGNASTVGNSNDFLILSQTDALNLFVNNSTYVDFKASTTQNGVTYDNTIRIYKKTNTDQYLEFLNPTLNIPCDTNGNILNYNSGQLTPAGFLNRIVLGWPRYYEQGIIDRTPFFQNSTSTFISSFTGLDNFTTSSAYTLIGGSGTGWIIQGTDGEVYMPGNTATITVGVNIQAQPTRYATLTLKKQIQGT